MGKLENKMILVVDDEKDIRSVLKDEFELDEVRKLNPTLPKVILVTGFADLTEADAVRRGAEKMFHKPFDPVLISSYIAEKLK